MTANAVRVARIGRVVSRKIACFSAIAIIKAKDIIGLVIAMFLSYILLNADLIIGAARKDSVPSMSG